MSKGTGSFGKRRNKIHTLCQRCGRRSYHFQMLPAASLPNAYAGSMKAIMRKTTGIGRMRCLSHVQRRFKIYFKEGTVAAPRINGTAAK